MIWCVFGFIVLLAICGAFCEYQDYKARKNKDK